MIKEEGKPKNQAVDELEKLLKQQEAALVSLRDERNKTIRKLRKEKLKLVIPSDAAIKLARKAGPMEDVFFKKLGEDLDAIEEIISTVLDVPVKVVSAIPEFVITNIGSRGVRLDNFAEIAVETELLKDCEWGKKGAFVDIEVQKEDNCDHEFRVFYNGASMVINKTPPKTDFADLPRAIVIYISAFDIFGEGEILYEIGKYDKKTLKPRRSPVAEIYVNTENLEAAAGDENERIRKVSALMKVFRDPDWYDGQFPAFSKRKKEIHETEEGVGDVSKELQMIIDQEVEKVKEEIEKVKEEAERAKAETEKVKQEAETIKQEAETIKQEAETIKKEADQRYIDSIRGLKDSMGWSTQQVMDALRIPPKDQIKYAKLV